MSPVDLLLVASASGALSALLAILEHPVAGAVPELEKLRHAVADWKVKLDQVLADANRGLR